MLRTSRFLKKLNKNVNYTITKCQNSTASVRQKAWQEARQRYSNYEHVHYSSFLECAISPLNDVRENKVLYPPLEALRYMAQSKATSIADVVPENWMDDYEFYAGATNSTSKLGTPDTTIPPSTVPCNGCGAPLHCTKATFPGYIPSEIFKDRTKKELQTIICQRCHFLKHFNLALDVEVPASQYVETISRIQNEYALAIVLVDLVDFPSSIWPGMQHVLGKKRPVFIVGNKVDLLPRDCNSYLTHVKKCLQQQFIQHGGFNALNIKNVSLISAKTGYGIEELITQLQKNWKYKGDVYILGCTNVGKSSLFNILLNSDYCRPEASELVRKATTCPWPGTTLQMLKFPILRPSDLRVYQRFKRIFSERKQRADLDYSRRSAARELGETSAAQPMGLVGRTFLRNEDINDNFAIASGTQPITTLNERGAVYKEARWVYDTPGVMQPDQLTHLLTAEELVQLQTKLMIKPRAFRLQANMSLFLGGLGRLDMLSCCSKEDVLEWVKVFVFASPNLPVLIADTQMAEEVYKRYLGTPLLGVPIVGKDETRLQRWPGLQCKEQTIQISSVNQDKNPKERSLTCDITLSSAGWLGMLLPEHADCSVRVWTPHAAGIYVREPPLIPLANRLVGKHIRNSLAYNTTKPFIFKK